MNENDNQMSKWDEAVEYGRHLLGVLPDGTVTGLLTHPDDSEVFFKSYIKGPEHSRYPRWEQDYLGTPLAYALENFARNGPMTDLSLEKCYYNGQLYESGPMEGGVFTGWRYEYERKHSFRRKVLRGEIEVPAPALFNRHGNIWIQEPYGEEIREKYWDFVESNYDHRMSHYAAANS